MKKYISILFTLLLVAFTGCDVETDTDAGGTSVAAMAGHWVVTFSNSGKAYGPYDLYTYNTAADNGSEMWINDKNSFWNFNIKCPVTYNALTFATGGTPATSIALNKDGSAYNITVAITDGKVVLNGTKSPGGHVTDSISFGIEFQDDPGNVYLCDGYRYTGFDDDK